MTTNPNPEMAPDIKISLARLEMDRVFSLLTAICLACDAVDDGYAIKAVATVASNELSHARERLDEYFADVSNENAITVAAAWRRAAEIEGA